MEKMLGVMLDCSRNAVMKPETIKHYANIVKKMGYNTIMLYLEDTYEIESQPYFGHLRGRYTKDELKDIDSFCKEIGMELIPYIQTLAHLESMFKWRDQYSTINDCDDILLIDDENTYKLIEDMISTISECFTSPKIHIGMDEAYRVGTGKYQKKHGICNRFICMIMPVIPVFATDIAETQVAENIRVIVNDNFDADLGNWVEGEILPDKSEFSLYRDDVDGISVMVRCYRQILPGT